MNFMIRKRTISIAIFAAIVAGVPLWISIEHQRCLSDYRETDFNRARLLILHRNGIGEKEMAERIKCASKRIGMECVSVSLNAQDFWKKFFPNFASFAAHKFKPHIILSLQGDEIPCKNAKQYIALTHGSDYYFSPRTTLSIQEVMKFDGFLVGFPDHEKLLTYANFVQKACNTIKWYSTCASTSFQPIKNFQLFYCGANMANSPFGAKYKVLFSLLDRSGYLQVFGYKEEWRHTPNSYKGYIRSDGESLLKKMHEVGVTLVLHDPDHYLGGTPTARIFEAAAAGTVIIADHHPFIQKEFGDSVLYIDQNRSPEEIFTQIQAYMHWIRSHPEEANQLAEKSHGIFLEKFTLEKQLLKLLELHKTLS